jgi:hypothetical protein
MGLFCFVKSQSAMKFQLSGVVCCCIQYFPFSQLKYLLNILVISLYKLYFRITLNTMLRRYASY